MLNRRVAGLVLLFSLVVTPSLTANADTVVATITVGTSPESVAIDPAGTFAYVTNTNSASVSKINLATDTVVATITVGSSPRGVAIDPAGTFAYVTNLGSRSISKIDLAGDTVVATITVGISPRGVAINPAGTFAYVTNANSASVSKINLATDTVVATITVGSSPYAVAINPAGTFAYVTNAPLVSKINLATNTVVATITVANAYGVAINPAGTFAYVTNAPLVSKITSSEPQSISFTAVSPQLLGTKTIALSATASSALTVAFTSETQTVCTVSGSIVTLLTTGTCTIKSNQSGGSGWEAAPEVSRSFTISPSPPAGEVGVSILDGSAYTNTKAVKLNLVWPEYATEARISNDGGFAASKTKVVALGASVDWDLDDSVKGIYTKVVYVRFNGSGIDTSKTYSDDIILDLTPPEVKSASATASNSTVTLKVKATDDISGVDKIEIATNKKTIERDYKTTLTFSLSDLGVSSASVRAANSSEVTIRVRATDNAKNRSSPQTLTVHFATSNFVRVSASGTKATITITLVAAQKVKVYRKVGGRLTLLKVVSGKKGSTQVLTTYRKTYSFVVKDAKGRQIPSRLSSTANRSPNAA